MQITQSPDHALFLTPARPRSPRTLPNKVSKIWKNVDQRERDPVIQQVGKVVDDRRALKVDLVERRKPTRRCCERHSTVVDSGGLTI